MLTKTDPLLELQFFGTPQLHLSGQALTEQISGKPLALFAYLAVTRRCHTRDLLADLLWSELNNQQARNNLRYLLPDLRQVVGDYLIITPQSIGFNRQARYWLDVEALQTTLAARPAEFSTQTLQTVLDLYQGEFLAGFTVRNAPVFEEWVMRQREELHTLALQGLYTLAKRYHQQGETQAGLATTQRLLHWEPWHEAGHRLQMQLLAGSGQRSAALAQYALCRAILADELGAEPEPATTALFEEIRSGAYDKMTRWQDDKMKDRSPHPVIPSPNHNLPSQRTAFFGREAEIDQIGALLTDPNHRLITLVGEGGVGKTRLALATAQTILDSGFRTLDLGSRHAENPRSKIQNLKFPDGIWFVALNGITAASDLDDHFAVAVAKAMGLQFGGHQPLMAQLLTYLRGKALLLIFDNAEHLLPKIADLLLKILQGSLQLRVLVTSRHLLNLQAEVVWRVAGLDFPPQAAPTPADLMAYSGSTLFVERAKRANYSFHEMVENGAPIAAICRLVEGLPLAIELAAALTKQFTCTELYMTVQRDYTILATTLGDLSPQHRSIQAMLDYSWRFLTPDEAHTLAACSVFAGGFTLAAAVAVTSMPAGILNQLVDQSLLQVRQEGFTMHPLVRQYAAAQLAQSPERKQRAATAHATYYMERLHGLEGALIVEFDAQIAVQSELENVRAAWCWSADQRNLSLLAKGLESLHYFYRLTGIYHEAIHVLETALAAVRQAVAAAPTDAQPLPLLVRLLCHIAEFCRRTNGVERGERLGQEALELGQRLAAPALQGLAYHGLARLAYTRGNFLAMRDLAEEGCRLARQAGAPHLIAECLNDLGLAYGSCTGPLSALPYYYQALAALEGATNRILEAYILVNLGFFSLAACQYQAAFTYLQQGLALQHLLQDHGGRFPPLVHLINLHLALGSNREAQPVCEEALALAQRIGSSDWASRLYVSYGRWQHCNGAPTAACTSYTYALQLAQRNNLHLQEQWALVYLGHALTDLGEIEAARHSYQQAIALHKAGNWLCRTSEAYAGLALLLLGQNEVVTAVSHVEAALTLLEQHGMAAANEPFQVYWICIQVLKAAGDPRSQTVLHTAYQALQEIANKLENEAFRQSFLENVVVNHNLITAAQAAGIV